MIRLHLLLVIILALLGCTSAHTPTAIPAAAKVASSVSNGDLDTAVFAGGCFWCTEAQFDLLAGVDTVISGYTGGHRPSPTYREVSRGNSGHAEAVMVVFDPHHIDYATLLQVFFTGHDPTQWNKQGNDIGTPYRSAIFAMSKTQFDEARAYMIQLNEEVFNGKLVTQLDYLDDFYPAEDMHQKYMETNPSDVYCTYVIQPKLEKIKKVFSNKLKK